MTTGTHVKRNIKVYCVNISGNIHLRNSLSYRGGLQIGLSCNCYSTSVRMDLFRTFSLSQLQILVIFLHRFSQDVKIYNFVREEKKNGSPKKSKDYLKGNIDPSPSLSCLIPLLMSFVISDSKCVPVILVCLSTGRVAQ